ncbi:MAG: hypothetical protein E5299_01212 [Burkholderia gladioli]|nr:MAG: hypothetical protein E5299_01212 [Burkholderia gladioli]
MRRIGIFYVSKFQYSTFGRCCINLARSGQVAQANSARRTDRCHRRRQCLRHQAMPCAHCCTQCCSFDSATREWIPLRESALIGQRIRPVRRGVTARLMQLPVPVVEHGRKTVATTGDRLPSMGCISSVQDAHRQLSLVASHRLAGDPGVACEADVINRMTDLLVRNLFVSPEIMPIDVIASSHSIYATTPLRVNVTGSRQINATTPSKESSQVGASETVGQLGSTGVSEALVTRGQIQPISACCRPVRDSTSRARD